MSGETIRLALMQILVKFSPQIIGLMEPETASVANGESSLQGPEPSRLLSSI